jgi:hypothetical protein
LEHRARFAGLEVEDYFSILAFHLLESGNERISIEVFVGEGDKSNCSVVREEDEHVILRSSLQNFLSLGGSAVTFEYSLEVLRGNISLRVIDFDSSVDIDTGVVVGGFIVDFAFEGVGGAAGNIVVCHGDDFVGVKASCDETLVGVEDISLMPVVAIGV